MTFCLQHNDFLISQRYFFSVLQHSVNGKGFNRNLFSAFRSVKVTCCSSQLFHKFSGIRSYQYVSAFSASAYDSIRESFPDVRQCSDMIIMRVAENHIIQRDPAALTENSFKIIYHIPSAVSHTAINERSFFTAFYQQCFSSMSCCHSVYHTVRESKSVIAFSKHIKHFSLFFFHQVRLLFFTGCKHCQPYPYYNECCKLYRIKWFPEQKHSYYQ